MSAYPTAFPRNHQEGAWTHTAVVSMTEDGQVQNLTALRVDLGMARNWVAIPLQNLNLECPDPTLVDILEQEKLLGAEKVAQMLWLYKEEFMKTTHELLVQVDACSKIARNPSTSSPVRRAMVAEFKDKITKIICIGQIHLAKSQKLWKLDCLARGNHGDDPLYKVSLQTHIKMYEHVEKSYRFALAGNRVKATKFAEKLQGDMDDIWTNMMELTDEGLDVHFTKNDENDKVQKTHGDWAQKEILDHIVEMRKNCLEVIEHLC